MVDKLQFHFVIKTSYFNQLVLNEHFNRRKCNLHDHDIQELVNAI